MFGKIPTLNRRAVCAAGSAAWAWITFAALSMAALLIAPRPRAVTVRAHRATGAPLRAPTGAADPGPLDYLTEFLDHLLFDFGASYVIAPGRPARALAFDAAAPTALLAAESLALVALLALVGRELVRRSERAGEVVGYLLAVPSTVVAVAVLFVAVRADRQLGVAVVQASPGPVETLLPALAVALPLAGGAVRTLARDGPAEALDEWLADGWLHAGWFLVAVVVAERLFGIGGLGTLWLAALELGDRPVVFAVGALFVVPFLLASALSALTDGGGRPVRLPAPGRAEPNGGRVDLVSRVRSSRRLAAGVALVAVALGAGVTAGSALVVAAVVALVVAGAAGSALAIVGSGRRDAVGRAVDPLVVIPFPVYFGFATVAAGGVPSMPTLGALAGLSIIPVAFQGAARAIARGPRAAIVAALGIAATGAGVAALLLADLGAEPFPPSALSSPASAFGALVLATTPIALGLLLVGEGVRR